MADSAFKRGLVVGLFIGLAAGGLPALYWYAALNVPYDARTLATPPWVEPQVCYVAKIYKGDPGQECKEEGPTDVDAGRPFDVSRNTIYQGSLTFAGLALFGSVFLHRVVPAQKSDKLYLKVCTFVVFEGTLGLALLHILFAGVGERFFTLEDVMGVSAVLMGAIFVCYSTLTRKKDEQ